MSALRRNWFILALVGCCVVAWAWPALAASDGLIPLGQAKHALIAVIFFLTGAILPVRSFVQAAGNWPLHLAIQGISLGATPLAMWLLKAPLSALVGPELAVGLIILAAVPTTITSCVVLTREAEGNVAAAVLNATIGNLAGIVITPLWITLALGVSAELPILPVIQKLGLIIVLPLAVGMSLRIRWAKHCDQYKKRIGILTNLCLLMIIWPGLADGFAQSEALPDLRAVAIAAVVAVVLHLILLSGSWQLGRLLQFARPERSTLLFCASNKTLALGIPLLALLFSDDPRLATFSLPLLVYHPVQLLLDAIIASKLKQVEPAAPAQD